MGHRGRNPAASAQKDHGGHVQPSGTQGTSPAARRRGHALGPVAGRGRRFVAQAEVVSIEDDLSVQFFFFPLTRCAKYFVMI